MTFQLHRLRKIELIVLKSQSDIHDSGHDSPRFELDNKIGVHRYGKQRKSSINTVSDDAPAVSARFIYGSTTIHDGSATIHYGGATNSHDASKIRYGASTVQAGSATTSYSCCILDES